MLVNGGCVVVTVEDITAAGCVVVLVVVIMLTTLEVTVDEIVTLEMIVEVTMTLTDDVIVVVKAGGINVKVLKIVSHCAGCPLHCS